MEPKEIEAIASRTYETFCAIAQADTVTPDYQHLPQELKQMWYLAALGTLIHNNPDIKKDQIDGDRAGRCAWEVSGGVIPGQPSTITRIWGLTSSEFEGEHGSEIFAWRLMQALVFFQALQNPSKLNWAKIEWIWF